MFLSVVEKYNKCQKYRKIYFHFDNPLNIILSIQLGSGSTQNIFISINDYVIINCKTLKRVSDLIKGYSTAIIHFLL